MSKPMAQIDLDNIENAARSNHFAHHKDTLLLIEEIKRLKRGDFTEEEFQNLCHNMKPDDLRRFRQGCEDYQDKLFGLKKPKDEEERRALRRAYEGQTSTCCDCGDDYPKADHMIDGYVFCTVCREKDCWKNKEKKG